VARESFDKEIQFLRLLVLTSGAYNRQQYAERLGISVHTFDKTIKYLKEVVGAVGQKLPEPQGKELTEMLRFDYYESADPLLLFLFRAKSLKESESRRLSLLLASLQEKPMTAAELLDACCEAMPPELALPDEKTIRGDLKYLEEVGAIGKRPGGRPYRYAVRDELARELTDEELVELYDFVDVMANTQVPSVQGYLLRDNLKKALVGRGLARAFADPFLYKYHYYSRILDEAHLHAVHHAIAHRRKLSFLYLSPKKKTRYASKNTNPLFEKETAGVAQTVVPLRVVFDHQYGRCYLIAHDSRMGMMKFRMEGLTELEEGEAVPEEAFLRMAKSAEEKLKLSWVTDTGRTVTVRARFYKPEGAARDFVKERVLLQGQWGEIAREDDSTFVYEIAVSGMSEIKPWLRSFGSSCEVLEPARLRKEFIEEWKELAEYYESVREDL